MGAVLSCNKMTMDVKTILLLNPFRRLMVVTMGFMLIILSNITLSDAKMMEGHFNATLDAAALIEKNRIPLLNTKWDNTSLCPKHLDKCRGDSESRQMCFNPCPNGYDYECVTSDRYEYGMEFCLDKKKTLDKGRQLRAIPLPQSDSVYLREEQCPAGTYKPERAPVFVGCAEHNPQPPHFIILTPGTTTAPPMGYCDWKNGFFNLDHYNYWYTNETYVTTCVHRSEHTYLCTLDYDILPNGTCSHRCVSGERDVSHQFVCINGTITDSFSPTVQAPATEPTVEEVADTLYEKMTTLEAEGGGSTTNESDSSKAVEYVLIFVGILVVLLLGVLYLCRKSGKICSGPYRQVSEENSQGNGGNGQENQNEDNSQMSITNNITNIYGDNVNLNGKKSSAVINYQEPNTVVTMEKNKDVQFMQELKFPNDPSDTLSPHVGLNDPQQTEVKILQTTPHYTFQNIHAPASL